MARLDAGTNAAHGAAAPASEVVCRIGGSGVTHPAVLRWSVPALYFAGILATFLREIILAATYGTGAEIEIFRLAFAVPNLLSTSLGPAFVAAVVPALMRAETSQAELSSVSRDVVAVNVSGVLIVSLIGALSAPLQARLLAPGYGPALASTLTTQIAAMWLFFVAAGCSFSLRALLSRRGVLWPAAGATVVGSGTVAVGCLVGAALLPAGSLPPAAFLTGLVVASGLLILYMHGRALPEGTLRALRLGPAELTATAWAARGLAGAVVLVGTYHFLSAVPRLIDRAVATTLASGTVAALEYSFSLITVPGILLGTSLVTMLFPDFARAVESADPVAQRSMIGPVLLALALATVAAAIMSSAAPLIVDIVYARGAFDEVAAGMTSEFLRWHSIGLPFMVATIILAQATLAFRAYGLVLAVGLARILAKWLAVVWLVPSHGLGGLAASFIVPEVVSAVVLFVTLQWRLGRLRSGAAPR